MHSMHTGLRRRYRLAEHAAIIHEMDMAIVREGGASQLSQEELRLVMMIWFLCLKANAEMVPKTPSCYCTLLV